MTGSDDLYVALGVLAFGLLLLLIGLLPEHPPVRHRAATTRTLSLRALSALAPEPDTDELDDPCRLSTCPHRATTNLPSASAWRAISPSPASPSANEKRLLRGSPPEA